MGNGLEIELPKWKETNLAQVMKVLAALTRSNFWGKVQLTFENGKIIFIKEEKMVKL